MKLINCNCLNIWSYNLTGVSFIAVLDVFVVFAIFDEVFEVLPVVVESSDLVILMGQLIFLYFNI